MTPPPFKVKIKVLIVDDSLIIRERLMTMLDEVPQLEIVGQAGNVIEATHNIEMLKPDAVILDILIPGGSGFKVLEYIKQGQIKPLVIILTNYPYPVFRQKCLGAGAHFFLDKSSEFEQIPELLGKFKDHVIS